MSRRTKRVAGWSAFAVFWLIALLFVWARKPPTETARPVPDPNGYEDFVQAGSLLRGQLPEKGEPTVDELEAYVSTNRPALERIRQGLARESLVPPLDQDHLEAHMEAAGHLKGLARLMATEAELARRSRDWDRLLASTTNGLAFALRLSKGGVVIDDMISVAAEAVALKPIAAVAADLPPTHARHAALALAALDGARESYASVRRNEEAFAQRSMGGLGRVAWELFLRRRTQASLATFQQKRETRVRQTGELMLLLAARAYTQEKGEPPASPAQLVPDYLPRIPEDPATGQPLTLPPGVRAP